MKIIAQSEVPVRPSYLHIAYVAATTSDYQLSGFLVVVITALVVVYRLMNKRKHVALTVTGAVIMAVIGVALLVHPGRYLYPEMITQSHAQDIYGEIEFHNKPGGRVPKDVWEVK